MLKDAIDGLDAHRADALSNEVADGILHHRGGNGRALAEAVCEVGRDVELAAADVNVGMCGLAERDDAGIDAVNQRAKREQVQRAFLRNLEAKGHLWFSPNVQIFAMITRRLHMWTAAGEAHGNMLADSVQRCAKFSEHLHCIVLEVRPSRNCPGVEHCESGPGSDRSEGRIFR